MTPRINPEPDDDARKLPQQSATVNGCPGAKSWPAPVADSQQPSAIAPSSRTKLAVDKEDEEAKRARNRMRERATDLGMVWPCWIEYDFELTMPAAMRHAISFVMLPAYNELVLYAQPGLAVSTGLTICHLLWLELLDQFELEHLHSSQYEGSPEQREQAREKRERMLERHLRLVDTKLKAHALLMRLREYKMEYERFDDLTARPEMLKEREDQAAETLRKKFQREREEWEAQQKEKEMEQEKQEGGDS